MYKIDPSCYIVCIHRFFFFFLIKYIRNDYNKLPFEHSAYEHRYNVIKSNKICQRAEYIHESQMDTFLSIAFSQLTLTSFESRKFSKYPQVDTQLENTLGGNYQKKLSDGHVSTLSYIRNKLESPSKIRKKIISQDFSSQDLFSSLFFHTIPIDRKKKCKSYLSNAFIYY